MDSQPKMDTLRRRFAAAPDSRAFVPLAEELRQQGRLEEALTLLEAELKKHPHFSSGLVVLGRTLLDAGSPERARQVLLLARQIDPDNLLVLDLLFEDAGRRGAWQEAADFLAELIRLEPDNPHWLRLRGKLHQLSASELQEVCDSQPVALPSREQGAPQPPLDLTELATMTLVDIYFEQGYRRKALQTLKLMARQDPENRAVQERLLELEQGGVEDSEDQKGMARALAMLQETSDRSSIREGQKLHFQDWLSRIQEEKD